MNESASEHVPHNHYTLKHRAIAWVSTRLFDNVTYTVRHGLLKGMRRRGGLGWAPGFLTSGIASKEEEFWEQLNLSGMTVYDIGSFQGLLALLFASRAKTVVCFEPNNNNNKRLMENLQLNRLTNVQVRKVGIGSKRELVRMVGTPLMPGGSSVDANAIKEIERSGSKAIVEEIQVVTLDEEMREAKLPPPNFIKIDIEGYELEALKGASGALAAHHPALFLEMHGETMSEKKRKAQGIVDFLWEAGYRSILHIESEELITPATAARAAEGHLYCK